MWMAPRVVPDRAAKRLAIVDPVPGSDMVAQEVGAEVRWPKLADWNLMSAAPQRRRLRRMQGIRILTDPRGGG